MGKVGTVLWDVGGVLLTNGWDHNQRYEVLDYFGLPREPFETIHAELNDSWEKGQITVEEYLAKTVFHEPRSFSPGDFLAQMKTQSILLPKTAIGILKQVAASVELEVVMLNNESRELNDYRIERFELFNYFDCFISSCYVEMRKPHTEIYKLALDVLQRRPEDAVFIDDRAANVAAATELGIHGIVYSGDTQNLASELGKLGITVTG